MELLDLPWEDILISRILSGLSLKDVFVFRCTSRDCRRLGDSYLERMKSLKLVSVSKFSRPSFTTLRCRQLRTLNLAECIFLVDELLVPLLEANPHLVSLNLSGCVNLTARCLQPAIVGCRLKTLKLARCEWFTVGALESIILHQNELESVDFSRCTRLTQSCLIVFFKKFNRLKSVCMQDLTDVDDKCLITLAKYNVQLQHLNLCRCRRVTDEGIKVVGAQCANLKSLALRGCSKVTERNLAPLRARMIVQHTPLHFNPLQIFLYRI